MKIYLQLLGEKAQKSFLGQILAVLGEYPGEYPVYLYYKEHKRMTLAPKEYWVADDEELYMRLAQLLGSENISIKD